MSNCCFNCGQSLDGTPKFCPHCGTKLDEIPQVKDDQQMVSSYQAKQMPTMNQKSICDNEMGSEDNKRDLYSDSNYSNEELYTPDKGIIAMFFRYDNRLNRKRYFLRSVFVWMIALAITMIIAPDGDPVVALSIDIISMIPCFMLLIRRLHDLNRPGWWCIGAFVPIVNFVLSIYVVFFKGTDGPNRYGPDPLTLTEGPCDM